MKRANMEVSMKALTETNGQILVSTTQNGINLKEEINMGTRGLYGLRKNGEDKLTYNHFDSYPDWLGSKVFEFCKETSIEEMNKIFDNIILVDENAKPTRTQIVECIKYYDDSVSKQSVEDWYCLLRNTQGDLNVYKDGLQYMIDNQEFIKDSLFCKYVCNMF